MSWASSRAGVGAGAGGALELGATRRSFDCGLREGATFPIRVTRTPWGQARASSKPHFGAQLTQATERRHGGYRMTIHDNVGATEIELYAQGRDGRDAGGEEP